MPTADKKGSRKSKKGTEKAPAPPASEITVRDCMMWPEPRAKGQGKGKATKDPKPSVYRSTLVHRDDQEPLTATLPPPPPRPHDGTAIEALRGWPGSREQAEEEARHYEAEREAHPTDAKPGKNSKKKGKKEEVENVFIGDLIHQRYLNEHMEKRRREAERDQRRKEVSLYAAKAGRRTTLDRTCNIKANRASQLRAIALAEKVETSPMDLWKMPRFTRGVDPHLATAGGGAAALRGKAGRSDEGMFEGCAGGCTCDQAKANYVDVAEEEILCDPDSPMATN